jgi:hypothetical protein
MLLLWEGEEFCPEQTSGSLRAARILTWRKIRYICNRCSEMNTKIIDAAEDKDLEEASKFSLDTIDEEKYLRKRFHQPVAADVQPMEV